MYLLYFIIFLLYFYYIFIIFNNIIMGKTSEEKKTVDEQIEAAKAGHGTPWNSIKVFEPRLGPGQGWPGMDKSTTKPAKSTEQDRDKKFITYQMEIVNAIDSETGAIFTNLLALPSDFASIPENEEVPINSVMFIKRLKQHKGLHDLTDLQLGLLVCGINQISATLVANISDWLTMQRIRRKSIVAFRGVFGTMSSMWDRVISFSARRRRKRLEQSIDKKMDMRARWRGGLNSRRNKAAWAEKVKADKEAEIAYKLWQEAYTKGIDFKAKHDAEKVQLISKLKERTGMSKSLSDAITNNPLINQLQEREMALGFVEEEQVTIEPQDIAGWSAGDRWENDAIGKAGSVTLVDTRANKIHIQPDLNIEGLTTIAGDLDKIIKHYVEQMVAARTAMNKVSDYCRTSTSIFDISDTILPGSSTLLNGLELVKKREQIKSKLGLKSEEKSAVHEYISLKNKFIIERYTEMKKSGWTAESIISMCCRDIAKAENESGWTISSVMKWAGRSAAALVQENRLEDFISAVVPGANRARLEKLYKRLTGGVGLLRHPKIFACIMDHIKLLGKNMRPADEHEITLVVENILNTFARQKTFLNKLCPDYGAAVVTTRERLALVGGAPVRRDQETGKPLLPVSSDAVDAEAYAVALEAWEEEELADIPVDEDEDEDEDPAAERPVSHDRTYVQTIKKEFDKDTDESELPANDADALEANNPDRERALLELFRTHHPEVVEANLKILFIDTVKELNNTINEKELALLSQTLETCVQAKLNAFEAWSADDKRPEATTMPDECDFYDEDFVNLDHDNLLKELDSVQMNNMFIYLHALKCTTLEERGGDHPRMCNKKLIEGQRSTAYDDYKEKKEHYKLISDALLYLVEKNLEKEVLAGEYAQYKAKLDTVTLTLDKLHASSTIIGCERALPGACIAEDEIFIKNDWVSKGFGVEEVMDGEHSYKMNISAKQFKEKLYDSLKTYLNPDLKERLENDHIFPYLTTINISDPVEGKDKITREEAAKHLLKTMLISAFNLVDLQLICWLFSTINDDERELYKARYKELLIKHGLYDGRSDIDIQAELDARLAQLDFEQRLICGYNPGETGTVSVQGSKEGEGGEVDLIDYSNYMKWDNEQKAAYLKKTRQTRSSRPIHEIYYDWIKEQIAGPTSHRGGSPIFGWRPNLFRSDPMIDVADDDVEPGEERYQIENIKKLIELTRNNDKTTGRHHWGLNILKTNFTPDLNYTEENKKTYAKRLNAVANLYTSDVDVEDKALDKLYPWIKYEKFYLNIWGLGDIKRTYGWKDWRDKAFINRRINAARSNQIRYAHEERNKNTLGSCLSLSSHTNLANHIVQISAYSLMELINTEFLEANYKNDSIYLVDAMKNGIIKLRNRINASLAQLGTVESTESCARATMTRIYYRVGDEVYVTDGGREKKMSIEKINYNYDKRENEYKLIPLTYDEHMGEDGGEGELIKIDDANVWTKPEQQKKYDNFVTQAEFRPIDRDNILMYNGRNLRLGEDSIVWQIPFTAFNGYTAGDETTELKFAEDFKVGNNIDIEANPDILIPTYAVLVKQKTNRGRAKPLDKTIPIRGLIINIKRRPGGGDVGYIEVKEISSKESNYISSQFCPPFYSQTRENNSVCCKYAPKRKFKAAANVQSVLKDFDKWCLDGHQRQELEELIANFMVESSADAASEEKKQKIIAALKTQWAADYQKKQVIEDEITRMSSDMGQSKWIELHIRNFMMGADLFLKEHFYRSDKQKADASELPWFRDGKSFANKIFHKFVRGGTEKAASMIFYFLKNPKTTLMILKLTLKIKEKICREISIELANSQLQKPKDFNERATEYGKTFGNYLHIVSLVITNKNIYAQYVQRFVVMFKEFAGENAAASLSSLSGTIKMVIEIAGICFLDAFEAVIYKQIIQEGYGNIMELFNPFNCIKPIMIPDEVNMMQMTGDCDVKNRGGLKGMAGIKTKGKDCKEKYKTNLPITAVVQTEVSDQIKKEFESGSWRDRGSNLARARENILDGVYAAADHWDGSPITEAERPVIRKEIDRQLLQQQFMADVTPGFGTTSAQGFAPHHGNRPTGFKKFIDWDLTALKAGEKAQKDWKKTGTLESRYHNYLHPPALSDDASWLESAKSMIDMDEQWDLTGTSTEKKFDRQNFERHHVKRMDKIREKAVREAEFARKIAEKESLRAHEIDKMTKEARDRMVRALSPPPDSKPPSGVSAAQAQANAAGLTHSQQHPLGGTYTGHRGGGGAIDYKIKVLRNYILGNINTLSKSILKDANNID
jgi:hypothetical protein